MSINRRMHQQWYIHTMDTTQQQKIATYVVRKKPFTNEYVQYDLFIWSSRICQANPWWEIVRIKISYGEGGNLLRRDIRELPGSHALHVDRGLGCTSVYFCIHFLKSSWNGVLKFCVLHGMKFHLKRKKQIILNIS